MVLMGSLRLIVGLTFLGVVIALCLWLLNRLFPTPHNSQNNPAQAALRKQQAQEPGPREKPRVTPNHNLTKHR
jgi:hypothetical protein